jgi:hypothetical protein
MQGLLPFFISEGAEKRGARAEEERGEERIRKGNGRRQFSVPLKVLAFLGFTENHSVKCERKKGYRVM